MGSNRVIAGLEVFSIIEKMNRERGRRVLSEKLGNFRIKYCLLLKGEGMKKRELLLDGNQGFSRNY